MNVRPETAADLEAIRRVNRLAFGQEDEADLVDAFATGGFARLSLVAEVERQVAGHVLFSDLPIATAAGTVMALALAPFAVFPEQQRRGIGWWLARRPRPVPPAAAPDCGGVRPSAVLRAVWLFGGVGRAAGIAVCRHGLDGSGVKTGHRWRGRRPRTIPAAVSRSVVMRDADFDHPPNCSCHYLVVQGIRAGMTNKKTNPDFLNGVPELLVLQFSIGNRCTVTTWCRPFRRPRACELDFGEGCIYPVLHRLEEQKLLAQQAAARRRQEPDHLSSYGSKGQTAAGRVGAGLAGDRGRRQLCFARKRTWASQQWRSQLVNALHRPKGFCRAVCRYGLVEELVRPRHRPFPGGFEHGR